MEPNYGSPLAFKRPTMPAHLPQIRRFTTKATEQDQTCIHIVRCLHQAKMIVSELQTFSNTVWSPLSHAEDAEYGPFAGPRFVEQVDIYLKDTFTRFTKIYYILCGVLFKLNKSNSRIPHFRLRSFRDDLHDEWQIMLDIRNRLTKHIAECLSRQNDLICYAH